MVDHSVIGKVRSTTRGNINQLCRLHQNPKELSNPTFQSLHTLKKKKKVVFDPIVQFLCGCSCYFSKNHSTVSYSIASHFILKKNQQKQTNLTFLPTNCIFNNNSTTGRRRDFVEFTIKNPIHS